jgi:hypothetical protein
LKKSFCKKEESAPTEDGNEMQKKKKFSTKFVLFAGKKQRKKER